MSAEAVPEDVGEGEEPQESEEVEEPPVEEEPVEDPSPRLVLLQIDRELPWDERFTADVLDYLRVFFRVEVLIVEVPPHSVKPNGGHEALAEHTGAPLKSKPGYPGGPPGPQLFAPHLVRCLENARQMGSSIDLPQLEDAIAVIGLAGGVFFSDYNGLAPTAAAPPERTQEVFVGSKSQPVGAVALGLLRHRAEAGGGDPGKLRVRHLRAVVRTLVASMLELRRHRACQLRHCMARQGPIEIQEKGELYLCPDCETNLLRTMCPTTSRQALLEAATDRYRKLETYFCGINEMSPKTRIGMRTYNAFEAEFDWLHSAVDILAEVQQEKTILSGGSARSRGLQSCIREVHSRQPSGMAIQRTYSEPMIKRTCLLDMAKSAPYRHDTGDMHIWSSTVVNRKHTVGGHYLEKGGSLSPKSIATFAESGLNGSYLSSRRKGNRASADTHADTLTKFCSTASAMFPGRPQDTQKVSSLTGTGPASRSAVGSRSKTEAKKVVNAVDEHPRRRPLARSLSYTAGKLEGLA